MDSWDAVEFPRVREMLVANCRTPMGAARAGRLSPFSTRREAEDELDRLAEIVALETEPELGAVVDIKPLLERARTGGVLTGEELKAVGRASGALTACRAFLDRYKERLSLTWSELEPISGDERLTAEIALVFDEDGAVVDSASAELARIRAELRSLRGRLVRRLETMMAEHPAWYGERLTIRHDRHVLPLRVEHRDKLPGVVHESSATGQTLFVEPMATVEDQNRLEVLRGREQDEINRLLRALSGRVAGCADSFELAVERVGRLDFLLAKKRFADDYNCTRPVLTTRGFQIAGGRHPVLERATRTDPTRRNTTVVPLDFELAEDSNVLLISGPNAGGKTVVLKTLGLFCILAASGAFIPARGGTRLPFYRRVFADIGDDQSLDANLSSFTAHVGKLVILLDKADSESLVLLDEIGASTSPEEGAALAIVVLEALHERDVRVVATSHFWALKLYVQDHPRMVNAAMGFDRNRPTYRLTLGLPGESSALEIAAGAGFPARLLERARGHIGQSLTNLSDRLRELEREIERARRARVSVQGELEAATRLKAEYETKLAAFRVESERKLEQYIVRQRRALLEARREVENLVREIRESQADRDAIVRAKRTVEQRLRQVDEDAEAARSLWEGGDVPGLINRQERQVGADDKMSDLPGSADESGDRVGLPGETVESRSLRQQGRLVAVEGDEALVAFGSIRVRLPARDLVAVPGRAPQSAPELPIPDDAVARPADRLNILGRTREEALEELEGHLAEVSASGRPETRILHGKGSGILQRAVWDSLRRDSRVSGFRFAEPAEGGSGVTVVELRTETQ